MGMTKSFYHEEICAHNEGTAEFWGDPISVYTDADAIEDGVLVDIAKFGVRFNGQIINRMTTGAALLLQINEPDCVTVLATLKHIAENSAPDREGSEAWGIFAADRNFGNEKLWLVNNEVGGYSLILPSEY